MEEALPPVPRPKKLGEVGRRTRMRANFFEMLHLPDSNIHHYDIMIADEQKGRDDLPPALNRRVFQAFEDQNHGTALRGTRIIYDGKRNMYSPRALPFTAQTFRVGLSDDGIVPSKRLSQNFTVKIRKVAEIVMEDLHRFLDGDGPPSDNCLTAITVLDVLIRHRPSMMFATVRSSFFIPDGARSLGGGAEVWQGYFQSARPTRGRMLVNLDVAATAYYEAGPLLDTVAKFLNLRSFDHLRNGITDRDRVKLDRLLKNLKVRVNHRGEAGYKRRYRISKLSPTSASQSRFSLSDGREIDVAAYFRDTYNIRLNFPFLPCIVANRDVFLPMEVCEVIQGQRYMRKLDEGQTTDMLNFTCKTPQERFNSIRNGLQMLNYRRNEYLQQYNVVISNDMVQVPARILPTPTVHYHQSSREARFQPRDGAWNLRDKKVAVGAKLGSWSVVVFDTRFPEQVVHNAIRELVVTCRDTGMDITNAYPPIMHVGQQSDVEGNLKQAWIRAGNNAKAQPQLILCILPHTGKELYAEIKRVSDTVIGVATQCLQSRQLRPPKKQYCANVCLKMNVKLGGMNSFVDPAQVPFVSETPTIIMGADVTHPAPGDTTRPSIAAVCASMDANASRYAASIRQQQARTEIIADLGVMTRELLKTFYQTCGRKPERILFYRDGVSEGELKKVVNEEIAELKAACATLEEGYKPTVTFIVVKKRHHARFLPIDRQDTDKKNGNAPPGTVVETDITHPFEFDFYLQSHPGLKGTSRPCHYHVLVDENKFTADGLQGLSYNLCYLYARATRAVSQVPPAYYAHLVCARARLHARGETWTESVSSEEGTGVAVTYAGVKPDLQKVMYFM